MTQAGPFSGTRVLVVEDDRNVRDLLRIHLRAEGCVVEAAADAQAAERCFAAARPDLMIVDIRLPGRSGIEFVTALRARDARATPAIFLTAFDDDVNYEAARAVTRAEYLVKPVDREVLLAAARRLLQAASVD